MYEDEDVKYLKDIAKNLSEKVMSKKMSYRDARRRFKREVIRVNIERESRGLPLLTNEDITKIIKNTALDYFGW